MANKLVVGDLVSHRKNSDELLVVLGFTYRPARWGNKRLAKVFCSSTGKTKFVVEDQLVIVSPKKNENNT
mgnify:FL=1